MMAASIMRVSTAGGGGSGDGTLAAAAQMGNG
jgi:hypothetical protein